MSEYLGMETVKPSKPIKRGDLYVFAKTTADQVIVDESTVYYSSCICEIYCSATTTLEGSVGEIDIYENFGKERLSPNLHTWANYNTNHTNHGGVRDFIAVSAYPEKGEHFYDTFHYVGMEWSKDYIDFYLDGEIFCAVPMTEEKWYAFEQKIYPHIDAGVTGGFYLFENGYIGTDGGIEELLNFEYTQYTDYVRIFQKNGERHRVWDYLAN